MAVDLDAVARQARWNSERWFPEIHDPTQALAPIAAHYALGLAGEAGEVANLFKKALRYPPFTAPAEIGDELADVFTYLLLLADECGIDLSEAFLRKQAVCEKRWGKS